MTKQETFDLVAKHLLTQGGPSLHPIKAGGTHCAYRGENNRKCAAGVLIPDSQYNVDLEGKPAHGQEVGKILRDLGHDTALVRDLQQAHDGCEFNWNWIPRYLRDVAAFYGLSATVIDETRFVEQP